MGWIDPSRLHEGDRARRGEDTAEREEGGHHWPSASLGCSLGWGRWSDLEKKGRLLYVEGRLHWSSWQAADGGQRRGCEVRVGILGLRERGLGGHVAAHPDDPVDDHLDALLVPGGDQAGPGKSPASL